MASATALLLSSTAGLQKPPHEQLALLQNVAHTCLAPMLKTTFQILMFGREQANCNLCQGGRAKQL